jgi:glycosyltransferase involved in cell wall biosynthesis
VSRNEAAELDSCLGSLGFCDEIIVVDLQSGDSTAAVAQQHGAVVVEHEPVPIVEYARIDTASVARHDWLLFTDPDEQVPAALANEVAELHPSLADDVALVWAPIQYYVGAHPLRGTIWGGENRRRLLVRRSGVEFIPRLYGGTVVREGYREVSLPFSQETAIRHQWVSGYGDWLTKHARYLRVSAQSRADAGEIASVRSVVRSPFSAFADCFIVRRGYRDRGRGLALSVLWATYTTASEAVLLREIRRRSRRRAG